MSITKSNDFWCQSKVFPALISLYLCRYTYRIKIPLNVGEAMDQEVAQEAPWAAKLAASSRSDGRQEGRATGAYQRLERQSRGQSLLQLYLAQFQFHGIYRSQVHDAKRNLKTLDYFASLFDFITKNASYIIRVTFRLECVVRSGTVSCSKAVYWINSLWRKWRHTRDIGHNIRLTD